MTEAVNTPTCGKASCQVASTGLCDDGHEPAAACPLYGQNVAIGEDEEDELDEDDASPITEVQSTEYHALSSGEPLDIEAVDVFLRRRPANFITIVGDRASGKTTLICSIYDRFLRGPFGDHLFAGSRTSIGLERRLHYARIESGLDRPDTPHTSRSDGLRYFHLSVARRAAPHERTDLLISDRAGETYQDARGNSHQVRDLIEVPKGDKVVILVDGERVSSPHERASATHAARQSIRVFLDNGALTSSSDVQVVLTKHDLLVKQNEVDDALTHIVKFQANLARDFAGKLGSLTFWKVSARDPSGHIAPASGVLELFQSWVTPSHRPIMRGNVDPIPRSEFELMLCRTQGW